MTHFRVAVYVPGPVGCSVQTASILPIHVYPSIHRFPTIVSVSQDVKTELLMSLPFRKFNYSVSALWQ